MNADVLNTSELYVDAVITVQTVAVFVIDALLVAADSLCFGLVSWWLL